MAKVTFIDSIGRTIYAEEVSRNEKTLTVKNPTVVNVQMAQNGSLSVSLIPLFLGELLASDSRKTGTEWTYVLDRIVLSNVKVDSRLEQQYASVFAALEGGGVQQPAGDTPVIKLFDE